ncbi:sugar nucleotide-binding protein [Arthrobacter roseus]|uniref:sugar nucleotide-binding protein n=1 Tax=Arthrobacter roseus TaxID=136274 RepID=UPI00196377C5|nr:sugar nucleotide-binding protein [Arthrobacter roseus]MBM7848898.1 dTDP-4-dehydrorhamnose 3,5-epimerase [Arthrobacter roseus]
MEYGTGLHVTETNIPGLLVLHLPVHGDNRGWFKENWQREKMMALGLPDFRPVQNNVSYNRHAGTTRGIHAEPWDKLVSVAHGRIFGAWVDLRAGESFGTTFTLQLDPSTAVFVPYGVGNSFQTLEDHTAYSYLVNDHWSQEHQQHYTFLNLADESAAIAWPISLDNAELSEKDKLHPRLADVSPMKPLRTLVIGANGQVGKALRRRFVDRADVNFHSREHLDLEDHDAVLAYDWSAYSTIINAAAYTAVDAAESQEGRRRAWSVNAAAPGVLARVAVEHQLTLIHLSSDYVFDGDTPVHDESEPFSPLGVYGQSKAAGDLAVQSLPRHYILRTSWVVGDGTNFVKTMMRLAENGVSPSVVEDQFGRLAFADDIARAIDHLLATRAAFGTYNVSCDGKSASWAELAGAVYSLCGKDPTMVTGVSTAEYSKNTSAAPRPRHGTLNIAKIVATGFVPSNMHQALVDYVTRIRSQEASKDTH